MGEFVRRKRKEMDFKKVRVSDEVELRELGIYVEDPEQLSDASHYFLSIYSEGSEKARELLGGQPWGYLPDEAVDGPLGDVDPCSGLELKARVSVAHLRGELCQPHPDASGVPAPLHVQGLQEGSRCFAVAPPDDRFSFEPDLAQACGETLGVGAPPPVGVAPGLLGAAQLLHECLLSPLDEVYEVFS